MKDKAAVALGKKRFKTKEEAQAHMELVRSKRWANKTEEERKAVGQLLKQAREAKKLETK